eukprot:jgi/Astpho2/6881/Aster-07880
MVKDGKEPERVTLQVFQRISTAQSQAKQANSVVCPTSVGTGLERLQEASLRATKAQALALYRVRKGNMKHTAPDTDGTHSCIAWKQEHCQRM